MKHRDESVCAVVRASRCAFVVFATVILLGSGCSGSRGNSLRSERPSVGALATIPATSVSRTVIEDGLQSVRAPIATSTAGEIEMFRFDPAQYRFDLAATSSRLNIGAWAARLPGASAIVNGGYYLEDGSPAGYFAVNGERIGKAAFDLDKTALLVFDEGAEIVDTSSTDFALSGLKTAMQTYPFLVRDGAPAVREDSGKTARRSFIGVDRDGGVWMGVVANADVTLYELSRRLVGLGVEWRDVVNLDGGPSTGISVRFTSGRVVRETFGGVPNVIAAFKK